MEQSGARTHRVPGDVSMERGERFKSAVKSLAERRGIHSDAALAAEAGVSSNTLRNWWKGKGLELGTLVNVADVLDVSVFDLLNLWQGRPQAEPVTDLAGELRAWRMEARVGRDELLAQVGAIRGLLEAWIGGGADAPGAAHAPPVSSRRRR